MNQPGRVTGRLAPVLSAVVAALLVVAGINAPTASAAYDRLSGTGSSWAGNAVNQWISDVQAQGRTVDYNPAGSSTGRKVFAQGLSDFAVSEIPYTGDTADPQDTLRPSFAYGMLPTVAGGTAYMYHLPVAGRPFRGLKLTQDTIARIYTGMITKWNDPAIVKSNPGVPLPAQTITVVVRSEGSGTTAQFTKYLLTRYPSYYAHLCSLAKCNPKVPTSYFPKPEGRNFVAQNGSNGVTTYTQTTPYTINYDEYSYAQNVGFPVASVQNAAGYYVQPTESAVAVALTQAKINLSPGPNYLSQDLTNVYGYKDPRSYPMSSYSYMMVPHAKTARITTAKGASLASFATYSLCEGQRTMGANGYSPLPMNLVLAAMEQVRKIPGIDATTSAKLNATKSGTVSGSSNPCNNPTFRPGDSPSSNQLVLNAPFPAGCNAACQAPWRGKTTNAGPQVAGASKKTSGDTTSRTGASGGTGGGGTAGSGTAGATRTGGGLTSAGSTGASSKGAAGAAGTGAAAGAVGGSAATGNPASVACDPETGVGCGTGDAGAAGAVLSDQALAAGSPQNLAGSTGWGTGQWLLAVFGLLAAALLLGPPFALRAIQAGAAKKAAGKA